MRVRHAIRAVRFTMLGIAVLLVAGSMTSHGASSGSVVGANVLSATSISTSGCPSFEADRTDFGSLTPGASVVLPDPCVVEFGSSNDVGRLRISQDDGVGVGMWQPSNGELDPDFASAGIWSTVVVPGAVREEFTRVRVLPDGSAIAAGLCGVDSCFVRFEPDGTQDMSFNGGAGTLVVNVTNQIGEYVSDLHVSATGVATASSQCSDGLGPVHEFCVVRVTPAGTPDGSFGTGGIVRFNASGEGNGYHYASSVDVDSSGRVVVAGTCSRTSTSYDFCVARLLPDGSFDTSFSGDGLAQFALSPGAVVEAALDVLVDHAGRIVVVGRCSNGGLMDLCVIRVGDDGTLDTTYDGDGIFTTSLLPGGNDIPAEAALLPDGRLVIAGSCNVFGVMDPDVCVVRLLADGGLDTSFSGDGLLLYKYGPMAVGWDAASSLKLLSDGRILVWGPCYYTPTESGTCSARLLEDGSFDPTYGTNGMSWVPEADPVPGITTASFSSIDLLPDGSIVGAGNCYVSAPQDTDVCIARFPAKGAVPQYADGSNDWDTPGAGFFGACLASVSQGTASIPTNASCPASDGTHWREIPESATQVAVANPNTATATASLHFGLRVAPGQAAGAYVAPIVFDVVAP